jgi:Tfp pilus assembly protein PilN
VKPNSPTLAAASAPELGKTKTPVISKLNLASRPFRNRTLPWTTAVVVSLVSLLVIVYVLTEGSRARAQADAAERTVAQMREERKVIEQQAAAVRQELPPDQAEVLEAAHALVGRKTFSWSQLFSDLESALPASVRVQRINVREVSQRAGQTQADLEMTVVGRSPDDGTDMMTEMIRRGSFSSVVPVSENYKQERGERGYEWVLRVSYVQRVKNSGGGDATVGSAGAAAREASGAERAEARR